MLRNVKCFKFRFTNVWHVAILTFLKFAGLWVNIWIGLNLLKLTNALAYCGQKLLKTWKNLLLRPLTIVFTKLKVFLKCQLTGSTSFARKTFGRQTFGRRIKKSCEPNSVVIALSNRHWVGQMSFGQMIFDQKSRG